MKSTDEKKGLFERLIGRAKPKKNPCCGGAVDCDSPDESKDAKKDEGAPAKDKKPCCCG